MRMQSLLIASLLVLLASSCALSHERSDGVPIPEVDGGPITAFDGGGPVPRFDGGGPGIDDGGGPLTDTGPGVDSGWHPPLVDAGPPGDRAGDVWDGYVESYSFPSGSDRVRIVFDSAPPGDGPRTGIVVFGDAPLLPPPTDPSVGYPPDAWRRGVDRGAHEGFEYPIVSASVMGTRVRVTVSAGAIYERWCELQMPIAQDSSGSFFGCIPNTGGGSGSGGCFYNDPGTGTPVYIDCGRLALCMGGACRCDARSCSANDLGEITFDFHVVGANGDGSVTLDGLHNVHLVRSP